MSEKPDKKGILGWISEALYERVEPAEGEAVPEAGRDESGAAPAGAASPAREKPPENPADLAARLREQISGQGPAFTQFLALVASFADIIPDEAGRYRAALKALEKTGGVTAEQVLLAGKDQLQALESQREVFAEAVSRKRQALRQGGGGLGEIRARIAELQKGLVELQEREQAVLRETAAEEGRIGAAEKGFAALLGRLQDEITSAREKVKSCCS